MDSKIPYLNHINYDFCIAQGSRAIEAFSIQSNTPALPTLTPSNSPTAQHTPSLVPPITLELAVPLNTGKLNPSLSFSRRTAPNAVAGWSFEAHSVPHSANVSDSQQWKHSRRACLLPLSRSSVPPSQTLLLRRKLCSCLHRQFCSCLHRQLCSSRDLWSFIVAGFAGFGMLNAGFAEIFWPLELL
ncbi:hypothetical protein HN51_059207 [Arachis hypogaea]